MGDPFKREFVLSGNFLLRIFKQAGTLAGQHGQCGYGGGEADDYYEHDQKLSQHYETVRRNSRSIPPMK
jgi:hypothetical protein